MKTISSRCLRGHSSLVAALDAELSVKRQADNSIVAKVERLKDGQEGDEIVSKLESVAVGTDEDGDEISSCIVVPASEGMTRFRKRCFRRADVSAAARPNTCKHANRTTTFFYF
jgi:hypothetical protein